MKYFLVMALIAIAARVSVTAAADADGIIRESDQRIKSATEKTLYRMDLFDAAGKIEKSRSLTLYYKRRPGEQVTLFKFSDPPVVQGTALLIADTGTGVNNIWAYLPATRRVRRIAGGEKSNWFMGTEFAHEDFEDYLIEAYRFTYLREDGCGNHRRCDVIEAVASKAEEREATGYSTKIYWIEKETLYPIRIDYMGKDGKPAKRLNVTNLIQHGRYWRPESYEMRNLTTGRMTRLSSVSRELDMNLDDYYVSQRFLHDE